MIYYITTNEIISSNCSRVFTLFISIKLKYIIIKIVYLFAYK